MNIGSNSWMVAYGGLPVYATAKSGVLGLTRGLARELGEYNVRINHIAPGWILTPRQLELWATPEALDKLMQDQCLQAPAQGRRHRPRRAVLRLRRGLRGDQPELHLRRRLALGLPARDPVRPVAKAFVKTAASARAFLSDPGDHAPICSAENGMLPRARSRRGLRRRPVGPRRRRAPAGAGAAVGRLPPPCSASGDGAGRRPQRRPAERPPLPPLRP